MRFASASVLLHTALLAVVSPPLGVTSASTVESHNKDMFTTDKVEAAVGLKEDIRYWSRLLAGDGAGMSMPEPTEIVAPNSLKNLDGPEADLSFCLEAYDETELRQQNFYSSDQFEALSGPKLITEVALRITRITGPSPIVGPIIYPQEVTFDAEFRLSTTPLVPLEELSTTFSDNYGENGARTILRDETWNLMTNGNDPDLEEGVPNPFDIIIKLDNPYLYDPSKGNLLFEYIIRRLETINCSTESIASGETNMLGPWIDNSPPGTNRVRLLYSFDLESSEGLFEDTAPVARFTFKDP